MDADRDVRLTFGYEESVEKSALFQFVVSSCKEKYKDPMARLFDQLDCAAFGVVTNMEDEIYKKFIESHVNDETEHNGRLINGLTRTLVKLIENWRRYIDKYIFWPKGEHPVCSMEFLDCLVMDNRGTIDYTKSAKNLLAQPEIGLEDKIKIACVHCLPEEIMKLTSGKNFVELSEKTYENTRRMVNFWKMYIKEKKSPESFEELIKIVGYDNQDGLMFFWEKLTEKQRNRVIVEVFRDAPVDLQVQWLDGMSIEQQKWIMRKCGGYMLINLMHNEQWKHKFYQVANFARYLLPSQHYFEVIYAASGSVPFARFYFPTNEEYFQMFEYMWEQAPRQAIDYIYQQEKALNLFWFFRKVPTCGAFKRFFTKAPQAFKTKFLSDWNHMETFSHIHTDEDNPKLFHYLVKSAFPNEQDAIDFKIRFMNEEFGSYIIDDSGKPLDVVLKKMFFTDEAIDKFKRQYLYNSSSLYCLQNVAKEAFFVGDRAYKREFRTELVFDQIINYVRQYLPEEEIETFKRTGLCQNNYVKKVFLDVMEKDRFDLVDAFLKWSISDDRLIAEYKSNFYIKELKYEMSNLIPKLILKKDEFETLTKLDSWCNMTDENRREMGDMLLKEIDKMMPVWRYLLFDEHFDMATNFLKFCGRNTDKEIQKAKNRLFVDINWIYLIHGVQSRYEVNRGEGIEEPEVEEMLMAKGTKIFEWFNASSKAKTKMIVKKLKEEGYTLKKKVEN